MDRNTKTKLAAGAVGALFVAVAVGAAGAIAATRALSDDESSAAADDFGSRAYEDFGPRGGFYDRGPFGDRPFAPPKAAFGGLDAAASYLGLTEDELRERLRDGRTLAEVAEDEGKSVAGLVDAMVAAAEERIDEAVDAGRLTEEHADDLKQTLERQMTDLVEGEPSGFDGPDWFDRDPGERGPRA